MRDCRAICRVEFAADIASIKSMSGTSGGDKTKVKTELKGDSPDMNYLGVKSVKMISKSCM